MRQTLKAKSITAAVGAFAILCATSAVARSQGVAMSKAETAEVTGYTLTMDNVTRIISATKELLHTQATDPTFNAAVEAMAGKSMSEQVALLERLPKAVAVIRGAKLTVHDYAIGGHAFADARTLDGMQAQGTAVSAQMRSMFPVSDAQATFASTHRAQIDALMKASFTASPH